ncbi:MAG: hypothetical protein IKY44_04630, partial [Clostridia bacterium]|nr:hypothetical protein [Clostridia bacterium]
MDRLTKRNAGQLLCVCIPLVLTLGALLYGKLGQVGSLSLRFDVYSLPWILILYVALLLICISIKVLGKPRLCFSPIIPVMVIFAAVVICYCGNTPQYDETLYYYKALISADTFDFTFDSVLGLAWHSHPMIPYALYITAGQIVAPGYATVVLQNLALSLVTIYCVYRLILHYVGNTAKGRICSALGSAVFALSPVFITSCLCLNSDFPILAYLPILLCAIAYAQKIVTLASALCLLFSKLPGTALGIIIIGFVLLTELIHTIRAGSGIVKLIKSRLCLIIPLIITAIYFIFFLRIWGDSLLSSSGSSDVPNCFTLDWHYIAISLSQFFVLQFNWILTAVIIVCGIILIIKGRKSSTNRPAIQPISMALVASFFAYLFYCVGYVTHAHVRYGNLSIFYLSVLAAILFCKICNIYYIRYIVLSIVSLLMLSSFFWNSDPVSNALFHSYEFSGGRIINTHAFSWEEPQLDITDSVVYNSKFIQLNELYKKAHKELEITSQDNIIHLNFSKWKLDLADSWKDGALKYDDASHERSVALWSEDGYPMPTCYYLAERSAVYDNFADFENQFFIGSINPDDLPDDAIIVLFPWQTDK